MTAAAYPERAGAEAPAAAPAGPSLSGAISEVQAYVWQLAGFAASNRDNAVAVVETHPGLNRQLLQAADEWEGRRIQAAFAVELLEALAEHADVRAALVAARKAKRKGGAT